MLLISSYTFYGCTSHLKLRSPQTYVRFNPKKPYSVFFNSAILGGSFIFFLVQYAPKPYSDFFKAAIDFQASFRVGSAGSFASGGGFLMFFGGVGFRGLGF